MLTLGFADGGHSLTPHLFLLTQHLSFFLGGCSIYPVIVPQLPPVLIHVVVIESFLINLSPILLYSSHRIPIHLI